MPRPSIRLSARRNYEGITAHKKGTLFLSRMQGLRLHLGWDPLPGVRSNSFGLQMEDDEAIKLRDWLIEQYPLVSQCAMHDAEEPCATFAYIVCFECGHVFQTIEEFRAAILRMYPHADVSEQTSSSHSYCPLCLHDFL